MSTEATATPVTPTARHTGTGVSRPIHKRLVLALACASMAMVGLDTAIVNVALPSIQRDLGGGPSTLQWVVVAYGLLLGGFLLLGGRLADHLGRRRMFVTGLAVFTTASLAAGLAEHTTVLIAARAVQGFGAALVAPAALSLLAVTFAEGSERDRALGIFGAFGGIAGSFGVVASGLLIGGPGWRWGFLINVPVGTAMIIVSLVFLSGDLRRRSGTRLDAAGASTATAGLLMLVYALHHGANHGWASISTVALFTAAAGLLACFARTESRSAAPLVPAAILRSRSVIAANIVAFLAYCALMAFIFIGSLLMQQILGYSPLHTGLAWLATTAPIFAVAMIAARIVGRVGVRAVLTAGLIAVTGAALWLARIPADGSYVVDVLPAFLLAGVGFGLCGPALQIGALTGVKRDDAGLAAGLVETMREIGAAAGVASVATVLVSGSGLGNFHTAFVFIGALAAAGMITAAAGLGNAKRSRSKQRGE